MARDETRPQLLEAAGEIFAEKGFQNATVREICDRAGANVASINYHFGDKERLYIEAVKNARRLREEAAPLPEWTADTPPEEKLRMFVVTLMRRLLSADAATWQLRLIMREIMEPTQACEEMVQEAFQPFFQILLGILREMLPAEIPDERVEQFGFSIVSQCVYYRMSDKIVAMLIPPEQLEQHYQPDQLAEHITRFSLGAIHSCSLKDAIPAPRALEKVE